jgi:hypothetical protein
MKKILLVLTIIFFVNLVFAQNPPAKGFDLEGSDAQAIEIADKVMDTMGGRKNWDKTRYISWVFFGVRKHIWDKWTGNVRIEGLKDKSVSLLNINTLNGSIYRNGQLVTNPDSLKIFLKAAKNQWINDSYWLLMPYKLKDSGVTLKYLGESKTQNNEEAYLLGLTFKEVGSTPQNKYQVWVSKTDNLVKQWAYFAKADLEKPNFIMPWLSYEKYGKILLSGDRGERKLSEIIVLNKLNSKIFTEIDYSLK